MEKTVPAPKRRLAALFAAATLVVAAPVLNGCAVNKATGDTIFTGLMSAEDEKKTGAQEHPKIVKAFGGEYGSAALRSYVAGLGQKLAANAERKDLQYRFTLLNSDVVNAFAIPGGYVYITRGLMALAGNEAELAAVLGHEIGHLTAQHHARRAGQELLAGVLVLGAGIFGGQPAAELGSAVASRLLPHYSREQELQSDQLGVRYISQVGYEPGAMADFLTRLRADSQLQMQIQGRSPDEVDQFNYMASHPAPAERVTKARDIAAHTAATGHTLDRADYLRRIDGIVYGESAEQGFSRGRVFAHPGMRIRFEVPAGFRLMNTEEAVIALGPGGSQVIFDRAPKPQDGAMTSYLRDVWARQLRIGGVEALTVNGMEAATGTTQARTSQGARDARLIAIRADAQNIYRFIVLTPPDQTAKLAEGLRRMTYSFRRLTMQEAMTLKPFHLKVLTVGAGDTVARLAARMPYEKFREERFRALNGLGPREEIRPGGLVKLVTE